MRITRFLPLVALFVHLSAWSVEAEDAWVRETAPGQTNAAAYLTLHNDADHPVTLVAATCDITDTVEVHESRLQDGMQTMVKRRELVIPAGGELKLEPGGLHLMLLDLRTPVRVGGEVGLSLEFDSGQLLEVTAEIRAPGAGGDN